MTLVASFPPHWAVCPVNNAGRVQGGRQRAPKYQTGKHTRPYLRVANVFEDRIDTSDVLTMDFDPADVQRYELKPGDILLNEGQSPEWLGRSAIYHGEVPGACFQNTLLRFQANRDVTSPEFAQYVFRHYMHNGHFLPHSQWTTNIAHLGLSRFSSMPFPLPPLQEQHRIVAEIDKHLTRLDAATGSLQRAEASLARYRASVLKAACEGRLVPTEAEIAHAESREYVDGQSLVKQSVEERIASARHTPVSMVTEPKPSEFYEDLIPRELPDGWATAKSEVLFTYVTSGSRGWARFYADEGALFLRVGNLDRLSVTLDLANLQRVAPPSGSEGERTKVRENDLLITITADVGMVAVIDRKLETAYINQHVALARPTTVVEPRYLAWYLASPWGGQRQFEKLRRGVTKAGLGLDDVQSVMIPLPPLAEQRRIVAEVERRFSIVDQSERAIERGLARAARLRKAILQRAFEGKLVPQDPSDEPASVLIERLKKDRESGRAQSPRRIKRRANA